MRHKDGEPIIWAADEISAAVRETIYRPSPEVDSQCPESEICLVTPSRGSLFRSRELRRKKAAGFQLRTPDSLRLPMLQLERAVFQNEEGEPINPVADYVQLSVVTAQSDRTVDVAENDGVEAYVESGTSDLFP